MAIFNCLKWPEMRTVALELIGHMHEGHAHGTFAIPVVDFVGVLSPGAVASERAKVAERGDLQFVADSPDGGTFRLDEGPRALLDLGREGLVMRIPARMSGRYSLRPAAFQITFDRGAELEGCKRLLMLVCNRVLSVDVSSTRVDVHLSSRLFDLCVEFD